MANEQFIQENINHYRDSIKNALDDEKLDSALMSFAKTIERETRHKAMDMAYQLANDINKL